MADRYVTRFVTTTFEGNGVYALIDTERQPAHGGEVIATIGARSEELVQRIAEALNGRPTTTNEEVD